MTHMLSGFFLVMKAEVVRMLIIMRRYWFASVIGIIIGYGMLIGLIIAFMSQRERVDEYTSGMEGGMEGALGLMIGLWAFGLTGLFTQGLQGMARTGELEQVCMSPYGLVTNFFARSLVMAVNSIFSLGIMLALISWTLGGTLHIHPVMAPLLAMLTFANLTGFGFMVGGLVLVFKQTGQIAMILRLIMIGLALLATTQNMGEWPLLARFMVHLLPITDAALCLKMSILDGAGYGVLQHSSFFFLLVSCVIWNVIGVTLFHFMEDWSRDKGTLGTY